MPTAGSRASRRFSQPPLGLRACWSADPVMRRVVEGYRMTHPEGHPIRTRCEEALATVREAISKPR